MSEHQPDIRDMGHGDACADCVAARNRPSVPAASLDPEVAALIVIAQALNTLPDDAARHRVIAYAQSRCMRPPLNQYNPAAAQYLQGLQGGPYKQPA